MSRIALVTALALWPGLYASGQPRPAGAKPAGSPPSLIVLITVDQLRGDYLTRFSSQLSGGLARLARGGAWFTNAHHDHAITETAPGHATLLSGRFPRSLGIADNLAGVQDAASPIVDAPGVPGASPTRFQGTTLVDWLRARDASSRALSVSMKDRGAILTIGRSRADVYWYLTDGRFTTSRYYRDSLPTWVKRFNARRLPQGLAGKSWVPLLPDSAYPEPDSVSVETGGVEPAFPHRLPADTLAATDRVRLTPWMDDITLALAIEGLRELGLGDGPRTDILAVSLSATDIIGHAFGPDSKEIHDQVLRLDRSLGTFVDSLFTLRDSSRIAIVLTSDHGVGTMPELAARTVQPPPQRVNLSVPIANLRARLGALGLDTGIVTIVYRTVKVDRAALRKSDVSIDAVLDSFAREVSRVPGVVRVDRFRDLLDVDTLTQPNARRWSHQFPNADDVELVMTLTPFSIFPGIPATHGSAYDYDTHVPLIFYGPPFRAGRYANFVRTVDLAPTLARIVGVTPSERLDGVVLEQAIR